MSQPNPFKPVVLCLSGHDPSGGAGLQADIEALIALFARTFVMEEALLRQSVTFLFMLADSRCDGE